MLVPVPSTMDRTWRNLTPYPLTFSLGHLPAGKRVMADDDQQFEDADAAVTQAVTKFASEIGSMFARWEAVNPRYIMESALEELCAEVAKLTDDLKAGPATLKLLDAMAEYRESEIEDR